MKKLIVNEHTVGLAKRQMIQAYKKTYLELQKVLLRSLEWPNAKKETIKKNIIELGEIYTKVMEQYRI